MCSIQSIRNFFYFFKRIPITAIGCIRNLVLPENVFFTKSFEVLNWFEFALSYKWSYYYCHFPWLEKICLRLRAHILRGCLLHPAWNRGDDAVTASCCDGFDKLKCCGVTKRWGDIFQIWTLCIHVKPFKFSPLFLYLFYYSDCLAGEKW